MEKQGVQIDAQKCIGCGLCAKACVARNIEIEDKKARVHNEACMLCGHCVAVCPKEAVSIPGLTAAETAREARLNPQAVLDVIRLRRSIRHFKAEPIPREVLEQILEAGRLTHTAKNTQDLSFVVLDRKRGEMEQMAVRFFKRLKPFADLVSPMARRNAIDDDFFFFKAPAVIVILARDKENGLLAAQNMEFVAEANGLGVLFSGFFTMAANHSPKIKKAIGMPRKTQAAMTLVLGYPDIRYMRAAPRKPLQARFL